MPQLYCQLMTLVDWLALLRSPGVSPAAKARPRFGFLTPVGEGFVAVDVVLLATALYVAVCGEVSTTVVETVKVTV